MKQQSREVLIELLFLVVYQDHHLSEEEDDLINHAVNNLGWESTEPRDLWISKAFAAVREASTCESQTNLFLESRLAVIEQNGEQAAALTWLSRALGSDGITPAETNFLHRIEARLFP
jgi:hypothetical protein